MSKHLCMKKNYPQTCSVLLFLFCVFDLLAQQDSQYTQYMYNTVSVNPAYAGTRGVLSIVGVHRSQWIGVDGAPRTQTLAIHSPMGVGKVGLGGSVVNDAIGPVDETYLNVDFSYTIDVSKKGKLSFGLKAGGRLFSVNFNELQKANPTDEAFFADIDNQFSPVFGLGFYYHTKKFYAGLSSPNLLETKHLDVNNTSAIGSTSSVARERINYYLILGHTFNINEDILLKPAALTKLVIGSPLQVDVSANFLFYEKLTLGLAYRWSAAVSALAAFQVTDGLLVGIAYDRETTELAQLNSGSFELMLRFELFKKYDRLFTPRFF